jgi:hypothetical protein
MQTILNTTNNATMPKYSIITVCYNEAADIKETLDSVVRQTSSDYEWIVVDGGSTDGTKDILEQYASRFAWWCSEPDKGTYNAMNKGARHAMGEYLIFMNGGDCFHDEHVLETMSAHLSADIVEGQALRKDNHQLLHEHDADIIRQLLVDGINHQSVFIRRKLLLQYPYDEKYKIVADWKFWLQTLLRDRCSYAQVAIPVADIDMTGMTYSQFATNLKERDEVLAELRSDEVLSPIAGVLREYNYLSHNTLVQYTTYLDKNCRWGYELLRKIAKRIVRWQRKKKRL